MKFNITTNMRKFVGYDDGDRLFITPTDNLLATTDAYYELRSLYAERKKRVAEVLEKHNELKEMLTDPDVFKAAYEEDNKPDDWLVLTEAAFLSSKQAQLYLNKSALNAINKEIGIREEERSLTAGTTYEAESDVKYGEPMALHDSGRQEIIKTTPVTDMKIKVR